MKSDEFGVKGKMNEMVKNEKPSSTSSSTSSSSSDSISVVILEDQIKNKSTFQPQPQYHHHHHHPLPPPPPPLKFQFQSKHHQISSPTSKSQSTSSSSTTTTSTTSSSITSPIQIRKFQSHSALTQSPTSSPSPSPSSINLQLPIHSIPSLTLPLPSPSSPHSPGFFSKSTSRAKRLSSLVLSSTSSNSSTRSQSISSVSISNPTIINSTNPNLMNLSDIHPSSSNSHSLPIDSSRPSVSNATIIPSSSQSFSSSSNLAHQSNPNNLNHSNNPGLIPIDFDEGVLRTLCNLECGLPLILDRLKQAIGSAREVSNFLKKKSQLEEEYGQKLSRLARSTLEVYNHSGGEVKAGSFSNQFRNFLYVHEKIGLERLEHSVKIGNVSDELSNVAKEVERVRKANKDVGCRLEKSVNESEMAAEKAKMKFELTAEELEKMLIAKNGGGNEMMNSFNPNHHTSSGSGQLMTKAISKLTTKSVKSAGQLAKMEEEMRQKMSNVSDLYRAQILATQQVRQEYFNLQLPRILRTLKEHSDEIDLGIQYYLTSYVTQTESVVLNDALAISSLPSTDEHSHQSLSSQIKSIDNRSDFKDYMANYAAHFNQTHLISSTPLNTTATHPMMNHHLQANLNGSPKTSIEIDSNKSFGVDLALQLSKQIESNASHGGNANGNPNNVPRILEKFVEAIENAGGLELVGVYRLSGTTSKIAKLKSKLDSDIEGVNLAVNVENVSELNDLTGALKLWLRELPEPLLTWNLYPGFIEAGRIENDRLRHIRLHERVNELPDPNYATLKYLMGHLDKVRRNESINSMSSSNLAVIFGPTLLSPPKSRSSNSNLNHQDGSQSNDLNPNGNGNPNNSNALLEMSAQCRAIETILVHYREIFVEEEEEEEQEEVNGKEEVNSKEIDYKNQNLKEMNQMNEDQRGPLDPFLHQSNHHSSQSQSPHHSHQYSSHPPHSHQISI